MEIDETSREILRLLQRESPLLTHEEIAEQIDVSASTVSNRLQELRDADILEGFQPEINYETAGIPHQILFVCSAPLQDRKELANEAIEIPGVVHVRELLGGTNNLHVEVVCTDTLSVEQVAEELDRTGLEIEQSEILRRDYYSPFNHFGNELVDQ